MTDSLHTTGTTKGSTLRARIDAREDRTDLVTGTRTPGPPSWVLDSIAERTLTGGFKTTEPMPDVSDLPIHQRIVPV
jgi:hypothetical protein